MDINKGDTAGIFFCPFWGLKRTSREANEAMRNYFRKKHFVLFGVPQSIPGQCVLNISHYYFQHDFQLKTAYQTSFNARNKYKLSRINRKNNLKRFEKQRIY